jgi:hypothetical protein
MDIKPLLSLVGRPGLVAATPLLALALLLAGCRQDEVTHYRVPKGAPSPQQAAAVPASAPLASAGAPGALPPPASPPAGGALEWTLPKGWTQAVAGGMRYATLTPPGGGKIDVSVVVLPGAAGGELANVNRWRGQIGLAPLDEAALIAARRPLSTKAGRLAVYDFSSDGAGGGRMVAALVEVGGNTWFLKMTGDAAPVAGARPAFLSLLESLRLAR